MEFYRLYHYDLDIEESVISRKVLVFKMRKSKMRNVYEPEQHIYFSIIGATIYHNDFPSWLVFIRFLIVILLSFNSLYSFMFNEFRDLQFRLDSISIAVIVVNLLWL